MEKKEPVVKLEYTFEDQEDFPELSFDVSVKTNEKNNDIRIIETKKQDRDASCNRLF